MATHPHESFVRDGYFLVREPVIPAELVARAIDGQELLRRGGNDTGRPAHGAHGDPSRTDTLTKIEQPQFGSRAIRELVSHPALGEWALKVTGAAWVQAWWVQLLVKPSGADLKANVGWHQDRHYWNIWEEGSELLTAWVALTDVEEDCGPMRFLRGSNHWGFLNQGDFFGQDLEALRGQIALPDGAVWEEVSGALPSGGVSFHDCLTFHGSGANVSGRPRRSFAVHLRTSNSRPRGDAREGLAAFIDDEALCPVYRRG
jgi:Phytanoyl-CoA dioxygenase (PhyH)